MIPALFPVGFAGVASLIPAAANVRLLMHGDVYPWFDRGNYGRGIACGYGATLDTGVKPTWAAGSFYTSATNNHTKGAKVVETGTDFALGTAFCLDAMVYGTFSGGISNTGVRIFDTRSTVSVSTSWVWAIDNLGQIFLKVGSTTYGASSPSDTVASTTWTWVRASYDGTTLRMFKDGVIVWSGTVSLNVTTTGSPLAIGNSNEMQHGYADQYLYGLRIVKGEALNTAIFMAPTHGWPNVGADVALQSNVTYSNAILRSTYDADVTDVSTYARTMTANGNAQISGGVSKFGGASLLLDGTGDYLTTPDASEFDLGTGDYQVQCWIYRNGAKANDAYVLSCYTSSIAGYTLAMRTSDKAMAWGEHGDTGALTGTTPIADTTWTHVAVGRKSGISYLFVGGVLEVFATLGTTANCSGTMFIGRLNNSFTTLDWLGSLDDLQLVNGECQLIRSFLVPTAALPTS